MEYYIQKQQQSIDEQYKHYSKVLYNFHVVKVPYGFMSSFFSTPTLKKGMQKNLNALKPKCKINSRKRKNLTIRNLKIRFINRILGY